jgi:hypothetical protein
VTRKSYLLINAIFIALIAVIFLYCFFSSSISTPITCIHHKYSGIDCPSCGLTRSITALLKGDPDTSLQMNKYGWQIFLFFLIQLLGRVVLSWWVIITKKSLKNIYKADWILSLSLFIACFYPFIIYTFCMTGGLIMDQS